MALLLFICALLSKTVAAIFPATVQLILWWQRGRLGWRDVRPLVPFFQDLGTNGRRCVSCHQPADGWTITPENVQARFAETNGADPIFRSNDGSDCDGVDSVNGDQAAAYSMLLSKGLIRIAMDMPPGAEFQVLAVDDPHACGAPLQTVSMYRRPLPSTNLEFLSAVMWDGRESAATTTIQEDLAKQANDATRGHAQGLRDLTTQERQQVARFLIEDDSCVPESFKEGMKAAAEGPFIDMEKALFETPHYIFHK